MFVTVMVPSLLSTSFTVTGVCADIMVILATDVGFPFTKFEQYNFKLCVLHIIQ